MAIQMATELVEAARSGGRAQIDALVEAIWPDAYRLARAIVGDKQGAEDTAQEACIILYRTIASLRSADAFRVWFYRIVVREATELKRRRTRTEPPIQDDLAPLDPTATVDVWRALAALPPHLRDVVVLRFFEDLPTREIATVLRIPDGTVRFRLMVAKRRLRPLLSDRLQQATHESNEVRTHAM